MMEDWKKSPARSRFGELKLQASKLQRCLLTYTRSIRNFALVSVSWAQVVKMNMVLDPALVATRRLSTESVLPDVE